MRANTQKAQRFFRPNPPEPISDLSVDLDPVISFFEDGTVFSEKLNAFYLADPHLVNSQQNSFLRHTLFEQKKKTQDILSMAEIGFGLGLNFVMLLKNWDAIFGKGKRLHYFAIEKFPLSKNNLQLAQKKFPHLAKEYQELIDSYPPIHTGFHRIWLRSGTISLTLIFEPTLGGLCQIEGSFDAWFLSQFSCQFVPDNWSPEVFVEISRLSRRDTLVCSCHTELLVDIELKKIGYKSVGKASYGSQPILKIGRICADNDLSLIPPWFTPPAPIENNAKIGILGAGIAGVSIAKALRLRGLHAEIIDDNAFIDGASVLPVALISPTITEKANEVSRFYDRAYRSVLSSIEDLDMEWLNRGVLKIKREPVISRQIKALNRRKNLWDGAALKLTAEEIRSKINIDFSGHGIWFEEAGTLSPAEYLSRLMDGHQLIERQKVTHINFKNGKWILLSEEKRELLSLDVLIVAAALGTNKFACTKHIPLVGIGGQLSLVASTSASAALTATILGKSYITPAFGNLHAIGSTHIRETESDSLDTFGLAAEGHRENYRKLDPVFQTLLVNNDIHNWKGYTGRRAATPDRLPCVGPVVDPKVFKEEFARLRHGPRGQFPKAPTYQPNLFVAAGFGSRGFLTAELSSEILVSQMLGEPWPVERSVVLSLSPSRFLYRELRSHK